MTTILSAASNAAQSIIKNIVQNAGTDDDDNKEDGDYDPSNAFDQSLAAKDKIEDAFGYDDDNKEMEVEVVSDMEIDEEEDEDVTEESALDSEQEYVDDSLSAEMELALANVRKLASFHQVSLVNNVCDTYSSMNGREPSINDLLAIFGRIKVSLAEEAADDELEANDDVYDDEADSDYSPVDGVDHLQVLKDLQEDYEEKESEYESELDDVDDSDYDPNDADDVEQAQKDEEDDKLESESIESEQSEKIDYTEDKIINSESFDDEYFAAIECVRNTAKSDKTEILKKIKEEYQDVFGEDATNEIIMEAFQQFVTSEDEEQENEEYDDEDDEEEVDDEQYEEERDVDPKDMELALDNIRKLAKQHQCEFVESISSTFKIMNGFEPSQDDLSSIFDSIKDKFADEARDDFLDQIVDEQAEEEEI